MDTLLKTILSVKDNANGFVYNEYEGKGRFERRRKLNISLVVKK